MYEDLEDVELIVLSTDEPEAFGVLFERHAGSLLGAAGWLYGIGRHQLGRFFRRGAVDSRARRRLGMPEREVSAEDYERIEELIDFEQVGRAIGRAFSLLSEEQREALTLRVIEGRTYREVAETLRCTEDTARARVSRGLRRLASHLEAPSLDIEPGR